MDSTTAISRLKSADLFIIPQSIELIFAVLGIFVAVAVVCFFILILRKGERRTKGLKALCTLFFII